MVFFTDDSLGNSSDSSRKRIFRHILGKFSYLIMKIYVVFTHSNREIDMIIISTLKILLLIEDQKNIHEISRPWPMA